MAAKLVPRKGLFKISPETGPAAVAQNANLDVIGDGLEAATNHAVDSANPHAVTAAQTGAATLSHTHPLSEVTDSGTAAALDVPVSGDAAVGEVVKGDDTRLTDARTPSSHTHLLSEVTDSGTAAALNVPASGDAAVGEVVKGDDTRLTDKRAAVDNVQLNGFRQKIIAPSIVAGVLTLDMAGANNFAVTQDGNMTTLMITNPAPAGWQSIITMRLTQDGTGGYTWAWPAGYFWHGKAAVAPSTDPNAVDTFQLESWDGGTTWDVFAAGIGMGVV